MVVFIVEGRRELVVAAGLVHPPGRILLRALDAGKISEVAEQTSDLVLVLVALVFGLHLCELFGDVLLMELLLVLRFLGVETRIIHRRAVGLLHSKH